MTERQPIQGKGTILKRDRPGLFQVRMPNGYEVLAYLDRNLRGRDVEFQSGDTVTLEFSAYDMTQARILARGGEESAAKQDV